MRRYRPARAIRPMPTPASSSSKWMRPKRVVLAGSGREVRREENGNRQIVTYAAGPARDFYLAASPDYQLISRTDGDVTFNAYAPEGMQEGAQMALNVAIQAFKVFGERYAPYPYTEFDIVSTPTYALGIEYPGIIALTENIYDIQGTANGTSIGVLMESTVAHEAGHQWFYNLVGNDQLDEPWLDESLTQFVTWQYLYGPLWQRRRQWFRRVAARTLVAVG